MSERVLQLDPEGNLGPLHDICVVIAQRNYLARKTIDTNPVLVQMILRGEELIDHWYYRSEEYIDQPFYHPSLFLQPYRGPAYLAIPILYGPGTYLVDQELIELTEKGFTIDSPEFLKYQ